MDSDNKISKSIKKELMYEGEHSDQNSASARGTSISLADITGQGYTSSSAGTLYADSFPGIITADERMYKIFKYIQTISISREPVLVTGECGVGKEMIARSIHNHSKAKGKFVSINIAGLDNTLFSDALFGHVKGAFTGADKERKGFVEEARGGTLFLDEIGDLSLSSQVKLLRLIQEKEYSPLGSDRKVLADVRIIVATNKKLECQIREKNFRSDLFFRLDIHSINIPPLRERSDDIELLARYFVNQASGIYKKEGLKITGDIINLLKCYSFPGNIRQLRSIIFDAVCQSQNGKLAGKSIEARLNRYLLNPGVEIETDEYSEPHKKALSFPSRLPTIKEGTSLLINEALKRTNGNLTMAAGLLGITRQALTRRVKNSTT